MSELKISRRKLQGSTRHRFHCILTLRHRSYFIKIYNIQGVPDHFNKTISAYFTRSENKKKMLYKRKSKSLVKELEDTKQ